MDVFTASYVANLAAPLTFKILSNVKRKAKQLVGGDDDVFQQSIRQCVHVALSAVLAKASALDETESAMLSEILSHFFQADDTAAEIAKLLTGGMPDAEELALLFEEMGYDSETLPGISFSAVLETFNAGFVAGAISEPVLQPIVQTYQVLEQTHIQQELLTTLKDLWKFLREIKFETLAFNGGAATAESLEDDEPRSYAIKCGSPMKAVEQESNLDQYLQYLIGENKYLQLQGIPTRSHVVNIELDQIFIPLRTTSRQWPMNAEETWLEKQIAAAPGELHRFGDRGKAKGDCVAVTVIDALSPRIRRLVVLGDPGSGKTTLLSYMALIYARDMADGTQEVKSTFGLEESGYLPILIPFRKIGAYLAAKRMVEDGTEGHAVLLRFLIQALEDDRLRLSVEFFNDYLSRGEALVLLDGLDELTDSDLRRRVPRLVEKFTRAYPDCRYVVTSRIVGYAGPARLQENYVTTTIQDFTLVDVRRFLTSWHRLIVIDQFGLSKKAEDYAKRQTENLIEAIQSNDRIRELAINPLMLTVIALVHRDRGKLPDRRAELYAEAVDILLGTWDEARGVQEIPILPGRVFNRSEKRLALQSVALHMHEKGVKELSRGDLRKQLHRAFEPILTEPRDRDLAIDQFIKAIEQRAGLLGFWGEGFYSFSHLTFQEYLAALEIADRRDYIDYTLKRSSERWWREVILLEAGYLSTQGKDRAVRLIRAVADCTDEPEPYHNLTLAAECLRDMGRNRIDGALEQHVLKQLRNSIEKPSSISENVFERFSARDWIAQRSMAMDAVGRAGAGYWHMPYGEPEWVEISAGMFVMGEGFDAHPVYLDAYCIAKIPVSNAQYLLFVKASGHSPPEHWQDDRPPKGKEAHPVVGVSWDDANAYCEWLSYMTESAIRLPTEAQWERAARGEDQRAYPWGDEFISKYCNSRELGLYDTTPVGIFPEGASPYGLLDMAGNILEWCRDWYGKYSKIRVDNPTGPDVGSVRVFRGGSYDFSAWLCRAAFRCFGSPGNPIADLGFRLSRSLR